MSAAASWTVNLHVEDPPLRRALERLLRGAGYRVASGADEEGAAGVTIVSIERAEQLGAASEEIERGPERKLVLLAGADLHQPWPQSRLGVRILPLPCGASELLNAVGACLAEVAAPTGR